MENSQKIYDAIILGAGASGLMCARIAAQRKLSVLVIDKANSVGGKIPISGGGKCNFTNLHMNPGFFIGSDTKFCRYALSAFTPQKSMDLLYSYRIPWEERTHGQLFCTVSARRLVQCLYNECRRLGCTFVVDAPVCEIGVRENLFCIEAGSTYYARNCVLAFGSPACPQIGGSDFGWHAASKLGLSVLPAHPVLTPFNMPHEWPLQGLSGISLPVSIRIQEHEIFDSLLFTHAGISGPAALKASAYWKNGEVFSVNFMPDLSLREMLDARECGKLALRTLISRHIPQRLTDLLLPEEIAKRKIAELSRASRNEVISIVTSYPFAPASLCGMSHAEACSGGVDTSEINPKTMQCRKNPNLYVIGELLDVAGQLGGYNIHWAWASGYVAGSAIKKISNSES